MRTIQFIEYTPEQLQADIYSIIQKALADSADETSKEASKEMLTRKEVADLFKVNLSTIHNWCKKGKLKPYGIGNRVYFRRSEVESSLRPLTK